MLVGNLLGLMSFIVNFILWCSHNCFASHEYGISVLLQYFVCLHAFRRSFSFSVLDSYSYTEIVTWLYSSAFAMIFAKDIRQLFIDCQEPIHAFLTSMHIGYRIPCSITSMLYSIFHETEDRRCYFISHLFS
jgi:hypothetical protein